MLELHLLPLMQLLLFTGSWLKTVGTGNENVMFIIKNILPFGCPKSFIPVGMDLDVTSSLILGCTHLELDFSWILSVPKMALCFVISLFIILSLCWHFTNGTKPQFLFSHRTGGVTKWCWLITHNHFPFCFAPSVWGHESSLSIYQLLCFSTQSLQWWYHTIVW